jgi:metal-responsive CopG/Arc/MetJ family transcriptional regulator
MNMTKKEMTKKEKIKYVGFNAPKSLIQEVDNLCGKLKRYRDRTHFIITAIQTQLQKNGKQESC